jgi:hypothetical protein
MLFPVSFTFVVAYNYVNHEFVECKNLPACLPACLPAGFPELIGAVMCSAKGFAHYCNALKNIIF